MRRNQHLQHQKKMQKLTRNLKARRKLSEKSRLEREGNQV